MGLTKQYLRYVPSSIFGLVASGKCNLTFLTYKGTHGKYVAVGACEYVFIWDIRKNEIVAKLNEENKSEVTCLVQNPNPSKSQIAVGYLDGSIRVYDLKSGDCLLTFNGHKSSISCLSFDHDGLRLISGSKDTDLVLWDLVSESGLFRLKGHKSMIMQAVFMKKKNILITCGKDMLVKFWDLDIRHCFKTLVTHRSEVCDLILINDKRLITGCHDNQLRVFDIKFKDEIDEQMNGNDESNEPNEKLSKIDELEDENNDDDNNILKCVYIGSLIRESKEHLSHLLVDKTRTLFVSHANEKHVEIYKINNEEEIRKRLAKKLKKEKRKLANGTNPDAALAANSTSVEIEQTINDEYNRVCLLKTKHKIKYVDVEYNYDGKNNCLVCVLLANNQFDVYNLDFSLSNLNDLTPNLLYSIESAAHRTDVRTIAFSSDSTAFLTASADCLKIWNRINLSCIRTLQCDYALCSAFLPDDSHVLVGCKSGKIQLFDINAAKLLDNIDAHENDKEVWSIYIRPDKNGFVSGSADHTVKFWTFELIDDEENTTKKRLSFNHYRTLQLDDDVLCVRMTSNCNLIAVALLDSTVKVFFMDTLKLFLNLYGHKQPVLSMDISFDNKLIVTASADRHIKIWGLDFGDCHRSLFAHEDSIMGVQFVGKTHYVFSVGKDGKLKEWDADKFERIITLEGHLNEIWAMAVSGDGRFVVTGSHDKSVRLWERTQEPLVLEDERETEKEQQYEAEIPKEEQVIAGETNRESGLATIKTIETLKSAEKLIEALAIQTEEEKKRNEYLEAVAKAKTEDKDKIKMGVPHPMLVANGNITAERFVLNTLKKIKGSEIETSLLVLEFEYVNQLLRLLCEFLEKNWEVELTLKCAVFLLKINYGQITTTQTLLPLVEKLKNLCQEKLTRLQDSIGFNLAGIKYMKEKLEDEEQVKLFSDLSIKYKDNIKKKKKKATILALKSATALT